MMPVAKHFDPVMGVDIHIVTIPPAGPVPIPHPHISMVMDPFDYVPVVGSTILVGGVPRATAGTAGKVIPHIPLGGPFVKPPGNEDEVFMGSATVVADGAPLTFTALPVLSCQDVGMIAPPRKKPKKTYGMVLPTSVVTSIPTGLPVLVGGPPTIDMMAMAMRGGMAALGGAMRGLRQLQRRSTRLRRISDAIHDRARSIMNRRNMSPNARNRVHRAICTVTGHPVDVASGKLFTEFVDFELPGPIPLKWERVWYSTSTYCGALGYGWHHNYDVELFEGDAVAVRLTDGRPLAFPKLKSGEASFDRAERMTLIRDSYGYAMDTSEGLRYRFFLYDDSGEENEYKLQYIAEKSSGAQIRFGYDTQGRLEEIVDSGGRHIGLGYNQDGLLEKVFLPKPDGYKVEEDYCAVHYHYRDGLLVGVDDALQQCLQYRYEDRLLVQETFRNGLNFHFRFDGADHHARCVETWGDDGIYYRNIRYDLEQNITYVKDSNGHVTVYHHDGALPHKIIDPLGNSSHVEYNEYAQIVSELNEAGYQTRYEYDNFGNNTKIIHPDGSTESRTYDANQNLVSYVSPTSSEWQFQYNNHNRLIAEIDPLGNRLQYRYNNSVLTHVIDAKNNTYHFAYDQHLNLRAITDGGELEAKWEYDTQGRLVVMTDARGNCRRLHHDVLGRVTKVEEPDGNLRELAYDALDNLVHIRDRYYDVQFTYSGIGRLASRSQAGTTVKFEYDKEEQLKAITNEHGRAYEFDLDPLGEVVQESGFDGLIRRYERNALGQVTRLHRPEGRYSDYLYDVQGRVTQVVHSSGEREQYQYLPDGSLIKASNGAATLEMERDPLGRLIKETCGEHWVASEYDALGNRVRVQSSFGLDQHIGRDRRGDVTHVSLGEENTTTQFMRDALGLELQRTMPGGLQSRWQRDKLGRPQRHDITHGQHTHHSRTYVWGVDDRLQKVIDHLSGETLFKHDALGNLVSARYSDNKLDLRMPDAVGNLFRTEAQKDREYGPAGQLLAVHGKHGTIRYEYDAEGNLVRKITPDNRIWRYEWSSSGQMNKVIRPDGREVTFVYDPLGRRIRKSYCGKTTHWVWDGNNPLHEWVEHKSVVRGPSISAANDSGADEIAADQREARLQPLQAQAPPHPDGTREAPVTWLFEPDSFAPMGKQIGDQYYPIVTDYLGVPVAMFNDQGKKIWSADISIWGDLRNHTGHRQDCPFRWPGQYEDEETGLYYNRFRYYDPEAGQYVSQDPIGLAGGTRPYQYTTEPLQRTDPFGLSDRVTALFEHSGQVYEDVNPTARNPRTSSPIPGPSGESRGLSAVNNNTSRAHAEVGAMEQSRRAGNRGGRGVLMIQGEPMCRYCQSDVKKMARALNLDSLEVHHLDTGEVAVFNREALQNVSDGGTSFRKAMPRSCG